MPSGRRKYADARNIVDFLAENAKRADSMAERSRFELSGDFERRKVAKMLAFSVPPGRPPARPKLDSFVGIIDRILEEDKGPPAKQQHTSKRIFERLRDEHEFRFRWNFQ